MRKLIIDVVDTCGICGAKVCGKPVVLVQSLYGWVCRCGHFNHCPCKLVEEPDKPEPLKSFEGLEGRIVRNSVGQRHKVVGEGLDGEFVLVSIEHREVLSSKSPGLYYTIVEEKADDE